MAKSPYKHFNCKLLGEMVRAYRYHNELHFRAVAKELGIPKSTLGYVETGRMGEKTASMLYGKLFFGR